VIAVISLQCPQGVFSKEETVMRRLAMVFIVLAGLLLTAGIASASHPHRHYGYRPAPRPVPHSVYRHGRVPYVVPHHHRHYPYYQPYRYHGRGPVYVQPYRHSYGFGYSRPGVSLYFGF
jgi:hypothetical protein